MYRDLPIRIRLTAIMLLTTLVCLALAGSAYVIQARGTIKSDMIQEMTVLADVIANRSTAAIVFDDKRLATENLEALAVRESIAYACIVTPEGDVFASYSSGPGEAPKVVMVSEPEHVFESGHFRISLPVMLDDSLIGTMSIHSDLRELQGVLRNQVYIGIGIFVIVGAFAFLLSTLMHRSISTPLADLARTAAEVAEKKDFSLRATDIKRRDELGRLVLGFNDMLEKIEHSDVVLQEQEIRFHQMAEATPAPLAIYGENENFVYINQRFTELFGYTLEDLPNVTAWWPVAYPDEVYRGEVMREWYARVATALAEHRAIQPQEAVVTCKDGTTRHIVFRGAPVGSQFLVLFNDLTARVQAEQEKLELTERLRQAQKMEAIGTLAGGVAHDFNNILSAIFGYTELAEQNLPLDSPARQDLTEVFRASNRARDLVQQILLFSRAKELAQVRVELPVILNEALGLIRSAIPTTITIETNVTEGIYPVLADPTSIHQVIMNLCTNAFQAMKEQGGTLRLTLDQLHLEEQIRTCGLTTEPGVYVRLEVADNGPGLDPETAERIFEPYFTTKDVGEGTGIGLAVVHGIVGDLKGRIELESSPGQGARFRIYLPVCQDEVFGEASEEAVPTTRGAERLLFVDDEEPLVDTGSRMLQGLGYQVTPVSNSSEALEIFSADPDGFDLVITDQTMPKMSGIQLAQKILAIKPQIPIILCSGFNVGISEQRAMEVGLSAMATKPLTRASLARLVRDSLDKKMAG